MDDARLLLAACAADPADDLCRLVYADLREERGDAAYARFIREQVRLTPLPAWHPDAARARWHEPALLTGEPFLSEAPPPGTSAWEWAANPFRRGLPDTVVVRHLTGFVDYAAELFDQLPIRELHLPTAALSEWRRFAQQPWLNRIEAIRFYGVSTPIDAVRALRESPNATGLTSLAFEKAGGPAVPVLLADLFAAPLGRQLRRLELHARSDGDEDWIDAFAAITESHALAELSLTTMGLTEEAANRLTAMPFASRLTTLELRHNAMRSLFPLRLQIRESLEQLVLFDCGMSALGDFRYRPELHGLRRIDNGHTPGRPAWPNNTPPNLVSLSLSRCGLPSTSVPGLVASDFWRRAVELDLRGNSLYRHGLELLIDAGPGPDLVALVLDRGHAATAIGRQFAERYEGRVVFA